MGRAAGRLAGALAWCGRHPRRREVDAPAGAPPAMYAVFVAYPFVARPPRTRRARSVSGGGSRAASMFFFAARAALVAGRLHRMVGALPVFEGAVMALLLRQLLRHRAGRRARSRPPGARRRRGARVRHRGDPAAARASVDHDRVGARRGGAGLALPANPASRAALCARLALLAAVFVAPRDEPGVFSYEPRGALRIFNWYLYTYRHLRGGVSRRRVVAVGTDDRHRRRPAAAVAARCRRRRRVLLFLVLNIEIADFYATGPAIMFRFGVTLAQDLTYTIGWLVFGMVLLMPASTCTTASARIAALALIAVTTFKCFLYDLSSLGGLYRVGSFVGLALRWRSCRSRCRNSCCVHAGGSSMRSCDACRIWPLVICAAL